METIKIEEKKEDFDKDDLLNDMKLFDLTENYKGNIQ